MLSKIPLHWKIIIGMVLGLIAGAIFSVLDMAWFVKDWIEPFGTIFINALKLIAVPLIVASLIKGVSELKDISKLSRIGGKTILMYIATTIVAVSVGLAVVNVVKPGTYIEEKTRTELMKQYGEKAAEKQKLALKQQESGPLQALVDIVPQNFMGAAASNRNMLQVIFFVIFFGVALILIPEKKAKPVIDFFDSFNEAILKMIDLIMLAAPLGVFALLAALVAKSPSKDIFIALGAYGVCVIGGLALMVFVFYPIILKMFTKVQPMDFFKAIAPAQLLAFSTSSSAATLPVTMDCVEENLGVDNEISSFVLPVGATINMDGTSLYQAVAAVFIAQVFGHDLTLADQLTIVMTATLASIGSAAVPGAGLLMLIIVLEAIGVEPAGIALIFAVDRPLDMCRTTLNVTGDSTVATLIASMEDKIHPPKKINA